MQYASITVFPYTALLTMMLLQLLSNAFQATDGFCLLTKIPDQILYFRNMPTIVSRHKSTSYIFLVFSRIIKSLLLDLRPLKQENGTSVKIVHPYGELSRF